MCIRDRVYSFPLFLLALLMTVAVVRLFAMRGRADVLVQPSWLSALAEAQRRMGFKHGTALLVSNEPVSYTHLDVYKRQL